MVLAVIHERQIEHFGIFAGASHQLVALHTVAVVGDGDHPGLGEGTDGGEGFAFHVDGDTAGREHVHDGVAFDHILDILDRAGIARGGRGVGHANHGGKATGGRTVGTGRDVFLMGLARLAEVNVDVDQPRAGYEIGAVDDLGLLFVRGGKSIDDDAVLDEEIAYRIALVGRIDDPGFFDVKTRPVLLKF